MTESPISQLNQSSNNFMVEFYGFSWLKTITLEFLEYNEESRQLNIHG